MVKGDGHPGRGCATVEEDKDEYNSRMEFPPDDVIAAFKRQQVCVDLVSGGRGSFAERPDYRVPQLVPPPP